MSNNSACYGYIYIHCICYGRWLVKVVIHSSSDNRLNKCGSSMSSMLAAFLVTNHPG